MNIADIQNYIEIRGLSYEAIAERLKVSPNTVRGWFSTGLPEHRRVEIEHLIKEDQRQKHFGPGGELHIVAFLLTDGQRQDAEAHADRQGLPINEYARRLLLERLGYDDARIRYF